MQRAHLHERLVETEESSDCSDSDEYDDDDSVNDDAEWYTKMNGYYRDKDLDIGNIHSFQREKKREISTK